MRLLLGKVLVDDPLCGGVNPDNSMVETFFKTIKSELIWTTAWQTRWLAEKAIARYIDGFYDPVRRHSPLGYLSPIAFERKA